MLISHRFLVGLINGILICTGGHAEAITPSTASRAPALAVASTSASTSACPSRTINYITETLPQQCLRTDWSRHATTTAEQPNGYIIVTSTAADEDGNTTGGAAPRSSGIALGAGSNSSDPAVITPSDQVVELAGGSAAELLQEYETSSTAAAAAVSPSVAADDVMDQEEDPLSDAASFVSFEEWKAKMLEKAGGSSEQLSGQKGDTNAEGRRRSGGIHQALDSLRDDSEIELEFSGFGDPDAVASVLPPKRTEPSEDILKAESDEVIPEVSEERLNAGTTSKERFNYASFDCAATVLKTNSECKGAKHVLEENKDSYMLNPCSVKNKFFIVELCDDIWIDTIALANYEFFSCTFRQVRFSVSDKYPVKIDKWQELGIFEAQNKRGVQAFLIKNGLIWGRYLRIELLGHYGSEYYCPISLLRVHGTTMIDDYRTAKSEEDGFAAEGAEVAVGENTQMKHEDQISLMQTPEWKDAGLVAPYGNGDDGKEMQSETNLISPDGTIIGSNVVPNTTVPRASAFPLPNCRGPGAFNDTCPRTNYFSPLIEQTELLTSSCLTSVRFCNMELARKIEVISRASSWTLPTPTSPPESSIDGVDTAERSTVTFDRSTRSPSPPDSPSISSEDSMSAPASSYSVHGNSSGPTSSRSDSAKVETNSSAIVSAATPTNATSGGSGASTSRVSTQAGSSSNPSTQESFFKSVHKRLLLLEANSTLSLQYIEEQSRILREAFTKVEKRQLSKTSNFLASLNETVLSELREFRTQYDQIWQSTILELSSQREQSLKEANALSARLAILADEVVWQKRLVYLQFGLILLCLSLYLFSGNSASRETQRFLELPGLRDMLTRSPPGSIRRYGRLRSRANTGTSPHGDHRGVFESPLSSPSRPVSRSGLTWAANPVSVLPGDEDEPDIAVDEGPEVGSVVSKTHDEPTFSYQPPTPTSEVEFKANGAAHTKDAYITPGPDTVLRRAVSSPMLALDDLQGEIEEDELNAADLPRAAELARSEAEHDTDL